MSLPELQQNPLVQRVIDIFDTDGNGEVDFKGNCISTATLLWKPNEAFACDEERSAAKSTDSSRCRVH